MEKCACIVADVLKMYYFFVFGHGIWLKQAAGSEELEKIVGQIKTAAKAQENKMRTTACTVQVKLILPLGGPE